MFLGSYTKYLFVPLLGFVVTYLLTPVFIRCARRVGLVNKPDERRIHNSVMPCGAGLVVFLGFHAACLGTYFVPWSWFNISLDFGWWQRFLPSSAFLLVVGLVDDRWNVRPRIKLGCQVLAALALYAGGIHMGNLIGLSLPWPVNCFLTVLWCVGFVNAFNLIDGLDGLAAGLAAIAATGLVGLLLLRHLPGDALILLGFIGACLAFLRYNFHPARVFLGDTGSMFIGLTLAAVSLSTDSKGAISASVAVPLLAAGVPIIDAALAVWRRGVRKLCANGGGGVGAHGGQVFSADKDHLHHRLLRKFASQRKVAMALYVFNALFVGVGLFSTLFASWSFGIYLLAFVVAAYVVVRHLAHVELWASGLAVAQGLRRPSRKVVASTAYPITDILILCIVWLIVVLAVQPHSAVKVAWLDGCIRSVAVPFLCLAAGGTYRRVWGRARLTDYFVLLCSLTVGILFIAVLTWFAQDIPTRSKLIELYLIGSLSVAGICAVRLLPRLLQNALPLIVRDHDIDGVTAVPTIVYGAGYSCALYLRSKTDDTDRDTEQRRVVGLLDDDSNLDGCFVYGYRVLGGIERAESVIAGHGVKEAVITTHLDEKIFRRFLQILDKHKVRAFVWRAEIVSLERLSAAPSPVDPSLPSFGPLRFHSSA